MPQSWTVTGTALGKTITLDTAQPAYATKGTTAEGVDLEAVWLGTGSEADYIGRNVKGKAVLFASEPLPGSWRHTGTAEGAVRRAEEKGRGRDRRGHSTARQHQNADVSDQHQRAHLLAGHERRLHDSRSDRAVRDRRRRG